MADVRRGRIDPAVARGRTAVSNALADLEPGDRVDVALSGGADSLALAACLAFVGPKQSWNCRAIVIDHGIQDGSDVVAAQTAEQARRLGLDADVLRVTVGTTGGLEAAAREARYAALVQQPSRVTLLGHTLDDQAETVLLGLGRGSGPRSIAGMRPVDPPHAAGAPSKFRRPFLSIRRAETERICAAHGLEPWQDPHNVDPRFRRSRVRHEVIPLLEDVLGGGVAEALARTASQVREDVDLLDELAALVADPADPETLASLPPALRRRVLRQAALEAGASGSELTARHIIELDRLLTDWHGQQRVELPGHVSAVRDRQGLHFIATPVAG
jgi:tRNA(Ile)-lysidine synthase